MNVKRFIGLLAVVGTLFCFNGIQAAIDPYKKNILTTNNVVLGTNLNLTNGVLNSDAISSFSNVTASAVILRRLDLGTLFNGDTADLSLATNLYSLIAAGATFTLNLPAIPDSTNGYFINIHGTNTSGGSQIVTLKVGGITTAIMRDELGTNGVTTITNNAGAHFRYTFDSANGIWDSVDAIGDALQLSGSSAALWASTNGVLEPSPAVDSVNVGNLPLADWWGTQLPLLAGNTQISSDILYNGVGFAFTVGGSGVFTAFEIDTQNDPTNFPSINGGYTVGVAVFNDVSTTNVVFSPAAGYSGTIGGIFNGGALTGATNTHNIGVWSYAQGVPSLEIGGVFLANTSPPYTNQSLLGSYSQARGPTSSVLIGAVSEIQTNLTAHTAFDLSTALLLDDGSTGNPLVVGRGDGGVEVVRLWPSVSSSGSATAYLFDTANVLTNGDKLVSLGNAGTIRLSVDFAGTISQGITGQGRITNSVAATESFSEWYDSASDFTTLHVSATAGSRLTMWNAAQPQVDINPGTLDGIEPFNFQTQNVLTNTSLLIVGNAGTNKLTLGPLGSLLLGGPVSAGSTNAWQTGDLKTGAGLALVTTNYIEIVVNGVTYKLGLVQ